MKRWFLPTVISLVLCSVVLVLGVGSMTETKLVPTDIAKWEVHKTTLAWIADSSGNVSNLTTTYPLDGFICRVITDPYGTAAQDPTNLYDITLTDSDGYDVLLGLGADEPNNATNQFCPFLDRDDATNYVMPVAVHGNLTLTVANAGNAKIGKIVIYWK